MFRAFCPTMSERLVKECQLFGKPKLLNKNVLPKINEVLLHLLYTQFNLNHVKVNKNEIFNRAVAIVTDDVIEIWTRASIPVISRQRVIKIIEDWHQKRKLFYKSFERDKLRPQFHKQVENFKNSANTLLDIASCKCKDFTKCCCTKELKVSTNTYCLQLMICVLIIY